MDLGENVFGEPRTQEAQDLFDYVNYNDNEWGEPLDELDLTPLWGTADERARVDDRNAMTPWGEAGERQAYNQQVSAGDASGYEDLDVATSWRDPNAQPAPRSQYVSGMIQRPSEPPEPLEPLGPPEPLESLEPLGPPEPLESLEPLESDPNMHPGLIDLIPPLHSDTSVPAAASSEFSCVDLGHVQPDVHVFIVPFHDPDNNSSDIRERVEHCVTSVRLSRQIDTVISVHPGSDVPGADDVHSGARGEGSPASQLVRLERTASASHVLRVVTMPPCGVPVARTNDYLPIARVAADGNLDDAWSRLYQHLYADTEDRQVHRDAVEAYLTEWPERVSSYGASRVCKYYGWPFTPTQLQRFLEAADNDARIDVFTQAFKRNNGASVPNRSKNINKAIAVERLLAPYAGALELVHQVGAMHAAATDACHQCVLVVACPTECLLEENHRASLWRVNASISDMTQVGDADALGQHVHSVRSRLHRLLERSSQSAGTPAFLADLVSLLERVTPEQGGGVEYSDLRTLAWLACADVAPYIDRLPLCVALAGCVDDGVKLLGARDDGKVAWRPTRMLPGASNAVSQRVANKRQWAVGPKIRAPASVKQRADAGAQMERVTPVNGKYRAESRRQLTFAWKQYARVILDELMAQRIQEWTTRKHSTLVTIGVRNDRKLLARSRLEHAMSRYTSSAWVLV